MAPVQPVSSYMIDYTHNGDQYYWKETKHTNVTLFGRLDKCEGADGCRRTMWTNDGMNTSHEGRLVESVIVKPMLIPGLNLLSSLCGVMGCAVLN